MQAMLGQPQRAARRPRRLRLDRGGPRGDPRLPLAHDLPVAVGFRRQALYDGTSPNFVGDLGVGSDPALVAAPRKPTFLAIGTRLGEAVTQGYTLFDPAGRTPIVHVYPDPAEIGRVYRPALGIAGDLNAFAQAAVGAKAGADRLGGLDPDLRAQREAGREVPDYEGPLNVGRVMRELETMPPPTPSSPATPGISPPGRPASSTSRKVSASSARPTAPWAMASPPPSARRSPFRAASGCFVGDGGMLMTGQEIATAFHHGVAPILLVFNNHMYGTIRMYQERTYPGRISATA